MQIYQYIIIIIILLIVYFAIRKSNKNTYIRVKSDLCIYVTTNYFVSDKYVSNINRLQFVFGDVIALFFSFHCVKTIQICPLIR